MPDRDMRTVAVDALRLQNSYAHAVDTRDWEMFRTLFTSDVIATYPNAEYRGMDAWLENFVPSHDRYPWTHHVMSNHMAGEDAEGVWASCYGTVRWKPSRNLEVYNLSLPFYRDRLVEEDGAWVIAQRSCAVLMRRHMVRIPDDADFPYSVLDLADMA